MVVNLRVLMCSIFAAIAAIITIVWTGLVVIIIVVILVIIVVIVSIYGIFGCCSRRRSSSTTCTRSYLSVRSTITVLAWLDHSKSCVWLTSEAWSARFLCSVRFPLLYYCFYWLRFFCHATFFGTTCQRSLWSTITAVTVNFNWCIWLATESGLSRFLFCVGNFFGRVTWWWFSKWFFQTCFSGTTCQRSLWWTEAAVTVNFNWRIWLASESWSIHFLFSVGNRRLTIGKSCWLFQK